MTWHLDRPLDGCPVTLGSDGAEVIKGFICVSVQQSEIFVALFSHSV